MVPKKNKNEDNFRNKNKKCEYFDRGYCKHGEKCNYQHPDKICSNPNCFDDNALQDIQIHANMVLDAIIIDKTCVIILM